MAINTTQLEGREDFISVFSSAKPTAFRNENGSSPRARTLSRGILIDKQYVEQKLQLDKGYVFQFNPNHLEDVKSTLYTNRTYAGLAYTDYIWSGGGERVISFQLFMDDTPQSHTAEYNPKIIADTIQKISKTGQFSWQSFGAFSDSRIHERGILGDVELVQSFLYPMPISGEATPKFAEGGIVNPRQFRAPATVVFSMGPFYLEGVIKSAPVSYTLFDRDLTPLRATIDIELAVYEFSNLTRKIER